MRYLLSFFLLSLLTACAMSAPQDDKGYYPDFSQTLDLTVYGKMMDSNKNIYSYTLLPGYYPPVQYLGEKSLDAVNNIHSYIKLDFYKKVGNSFVDETVDLYVKYINEANWILPYWVRTFKRKEPQDLEFIKTAILIPCVLIKTAYCLPFEVIYLSSNTVINIVRPYYVFAAPAIKMPINLVSGTVVMGSATTWQTLLLPAHMALLSRPDSETITTYWIERQSASLAKEKKEEVSTPIQTSREKDIQAIDQLEKDILSLKITLEEAQKRDSKLILLIDNYLKNATHYPIKDDFIYIQDPRLVEEIIIIFEEELIKNQN